MHNVNHGAVLLKIYADKTRLPPVVHRNIMADMIKLIKCLHRANSTNSNQ